MRRTNRGGGSAPTGLVSGKTRDRVLVSSGPGAAHGPQGHRLYRFHVDTGIQNLGTHSARGPGALQDPELAAEVPDGVGRATLGASPEYRRNQYRSPNACEDQHYHNAQRSSTYLL